MLVKGATAITQTSVDQDIWRLMALIDHSALGKETQQIKAWVSYLHVILFIVL